MQLLLTLTVEDLERTERFYREVLGLTLERLEVFPGRPGALLLRRGTAAVLFRAAAVQQALHPALFASWHRHAAGVGVSLELPVRRLRPLQRALDRHGLHPVYELADDEHRRHEVWLHDPDGYLLVLSEEGAEEEK